MHIAKCFACSLLMTSVYFFGSMTAVDPVYAEESTVEESTTKDSAADSPSLYEISQSLLKIGFSYQEIHKELTKRFGQLDEVAIAILEAQDVDPKFIEMLRRKMQSKTDAAEVDAADATEKNSDTRHDASHVEATTTANTESQDISVDDDRISTTADAQTLSLGEVRGRYEAGQTLSTISEALTEDDISLTISADELRELNDAGELQLLLAGLLNRDQISAANMRTTAGIVANNSVDAANPKGEPVQDSVQTKAEVAELFSLANRAVEKLQLTTPADDNAFDYYTRILALEPANVDAKIGIDRLVDIYIGLAQSARQKGNRSLASQYLDTARRISPQATGRINSAETTMMARLEPVDIETITDAKNAYKDGLLTRDQYDGVVSRLKRQLNIRVRELRNQLDAGEIDKQVYKRLVRQEKLRYQG